MGYHHIDPSALDLTPEYPCDRRAISDASDLTTLQLARYDLAPGEELSRTYHYHELREEALYVLAGSLSVETPDRTYVIEPAEVFVAEPDSPHRAYNPDDADAPVRVLGMGAPRTDVARPYDPDVEDE
jgi:quercetin dioxygenase-like cupin family protein